ncbi:MAG: hypothetical protein HRU19_20870 [Pseudobacteriovorax sp.]|nr:hypothetical protein [Pseudobacteriovorax sp.]
MKCLVFLGLIFMASCSTTEPDYRAKEIETEMTEVGKVEDGRYGYNEKGEVIIQKEKDPGQDLMIAQRVNENLFLELERDAFDLDECIQQFSDPSLNGDGKYKRVKDYENLRPNYEKTREMGVDENGKLKIVEKQYLKKVMAETQTQQSNLRKALRFVQGELRKCKTDLKYRKKSLNK